MEEFERQAQVERRPPGGDSLTVLLRAILDDRSEEAQELFRRFITERKVLQNENIATFQLVDFLGLAVAVKDRELCSVLAERLAPAAFLSTANLTQTCPARHLGAAAALLGERDKAMVYYRQALEAASKIRFRPETALTHLQLAELLLAPLTSSGQSTADERADALEHLDFATGELRDMKMQPALDRAVALKDKAESGPVKEAYPDGLTRREVEVLGLIAAGNSNREIGDELFISVRTVERHINNIYRKIDARGRAAAVAYALRHDMSEPTT